MTPLVARADDAMEGDKAARCDADARRIADAAMEGDKAARCDADARRIADDFCARLAEASRAGASAVDALVLDPALAAALADDSLDALAAPVLDAGLARSLPLLDAAAAAPPSCSAARRRRPRRPRGRAAGRGAARHVGRRRRARTARCRRRLFSAAPLPRLHASLRGARAADGGRVHRMHQDDSDLTLAVAVGGPWRGADLTYARDAAGRPGTPEPGGRGVEAATHAHAPGRGVVHVGDAYHRVEPLASGARGTLVLMSMRDDAAWKRRYYDDDGESASRARATLAALRHELDALRVAYRDLEGAHAATRRELARARANVTALAADAAKAERLKRRMQIEVHQLRDVAQTATTKALRADADAKRLASRRPATPAPAPAPAPLEEAPGR
ncbi:hypothetical protein JL721_7719 [Aureococcus anophagefferens]|nr:hypothetical protein JL721_7719 [Aureococcus anophagefferens]